MADCVECGHLPDETGHRCNRCGEEVCWNHRHPGAHDCESRTDPPARGRERRDDPGVEEWIEADPGAGEWTQVDRASGERSRAALDEEWTRADRGVEAPPVDEAEWERDGRRFPWWVYVLVALAVAVAPFGGLLVSILL